MPAEQDALVELIVDAPLGEQLVVSPRLGDLPFVEDDDLVGPPNRGESMSDDEGGAPAHEIRECLLNKTLS